MTDLGSRAAHIDDALAALGGEDADFRVKGIPGTQGAPYAVGLFCGLCKVENSRLGAGVYSVGEIELWELVIDAREHYEAKHAAGGASQDMPQGGERP